MQAMKLEFHPEAELELIEAALHYELQVPGLGERFESEVQRATDFLLDHPEIGPPVDPDLRRFVLPRFPFTLIYRVWHLMCSASKRLHTKAICPATGSRELTANRINTDRCAAGYAGRSASKEEN